MTIQYKDFFLKALPDDLPLIKPEQAVIPPDARKVAPQGQDKPRKPDASTSTGENARNLRDSTVSQAAS